MVEYFEFDQNLANFSQLTQLSNLMPQFMPQMPICQKFDNCLNVTDSASEVRSNSINLMSGQQNNNKSAVYPPKQDRNNMTFENINSSFTHRKKNKLKINKNGVPRPKRAISAYFQFMAYFMDEMKNKRQYKSRDFGGKCSKQWNKMSNEDKSPFFEIATRDRERYHSELAAYKPPRDKNMPKRPGSAFIYFMADFRKEMAPKIKDKRAINIAKLAAERWRNMSDEDKRPYFNKHIEEGIKYNRLIIDYWSKVKLLEIG